MSTISTPRLLDPVRQSIAPGGRPAPSDAEPLITEVAALAELLAQVVELAERSAVFSGHWEMLAEQAMEHPSVRAALLAAQQDAS
jgi:hypothetical protein